jgi:hypothetical protein
MPRDNRLEHLHPAFRAPVESLIEKLTQDGLAFRLFEGYRSPQRQRELYAQGRENSEPIVTKAKPWLSYHQYGLAADFVLYEGGQWSWDGGGRRKKWWSRLHELAREVGLEPLSWELPHVQLAGLDINDLHRGSLPAGGDDSWARNYDTAIENWTGQPAAPAASDSSARRPALIDPGHEIDSGDVQEDVARSYRVIARGTLRLRAGPGVEHEVIGSLVSGQRVQVRGSRGEWALVDVQGDGLVDGFCHRSYLAPAG